MTISKKIKNLQGKKFSRLFVVELNHLEPKQKNSSYWKCLCDCGNFVIVKGTLLSSENTKSCGCLQKQLASRIIKRENYKKALPLGDAAKNDLYRQYKKGAKNRNLDFLISYEEFIEITLKNCDYCNAKPSAIHSNPHWNGCHLYNGIDRVDNNKGYFIGNVVPCCKRCNAAKSNLSKDEFLNLVVNIFYNKKLNLINHE